MVVVFNGQFDSLLSTRPWVSILKSLVKGNIGLYTCADQIVPESYTQTTHLLV